MSFVIVLILIGVVYIGMQYLQTFQKMVGELREMRMKCLGSSTVPGEQPLTERFLSLLEKMKNKA